MDLPGNKKSVCNISNVWELQIKTMNYLVMQASSVNLINGLYLDSNQTHALYKLSLQSESHSNNQHYENVIKDEYGISEILHTLIKLNKVLISGNTPDASLEIDVNEKRIKQVDIIKRSLLAAQKPGYKSEGCQKCHAAPNLFIKGNIDNLDTKSISPADRDEIDLAHINGLFGEQFTWWIWEKKKLVDSILNNEQRYSFSSFRCCLVPESGNSVSGIIGQSFVTSKWIDYFSSARKLDDSDWKKYKNLYFIPLEDIIDAKLPGIKKSVKKSKILKSEEILNHARKLNNIEFALAKEELCLQLQSCLNIDAFNGELYRSNDQRQFIAALFLLFPGSHIIYKNKINR